MKRKTKEQLLNELESLKERLKELEIANIEQKKVIEVLSESEAKYRLLFDAAPVGIGIADLEGNIIDANGTMQEMSGYSLDEYRAIGVGATYADPEERKILLKSLREKGKVRDWEGGLKRKDGSQYQALLNADIMELGGRKVVLGIIRDISERKQAEEAIRTGNERLTLAQEVGKIGSFEWLIQENKTIWTKQMEVLYGLQPGDFGGRNEHWEKMLHPEDHDRVMAQAARAMSEREDIEIEFRIVWQDGSVHWILDKACTIYSDTGKPLRMVGVNMDITERKRVEEELKQSEEKYRLLIENIQEGVFVIQDAKMQFANQAFAEIVGYSIEEIIGTDFYHFVAPEDLEMVKDRYYRRQKGEEVPREYEFHALRKNGEKPIVNMNVGIVTYRGRVASMGILRDITVKKRAEESLKLFSETVQNAPDGVQIVNLEGKIIYSNKAVEQIYGFSHDELLGKNVGEMNVDPEIAEKEILPGIIENGGWTGELIVRHKDGHEFPIWLTTSMVKDETGVPIAMAGIIRDITEKKKVEMALLESETRYRTLFESASDAIFILEGEGNDIGRIMSANRAAEEMHGYSLNELLELKISDLDTKESRLLAGKIIERILNGEKIKTELDHERKDGTVFPVEISAGLFDLGGHKYVFAIDRDISERKLVQEALSLSNLKLEESNRTKELFTDIMHHDLLNPLNVAHGYVETFLEDERNHLKRSYLETIKRNLIKGIELIDNATKFSKLESMQNIEFEGLDLKKVINEVIENLTPLAFKANIRIENGLKDKMPARANKIIEDVFSNLISNAIKYAPHGKKIVVDGKGGNSYWIVRIMDFGPGIKDEDKKLIFERFHRGDKLGIKGSGLGLAIARKIVDLHNGKIRVEDNPEGGAVFVVEIPKR